MENRITLKHLIELLRIKHEIEIRDKDNYRLFNCLSNSQALEPYFDREVVEWFVIGNREVLSSDDVKVVILLGEQE